MILNERTYRLRIDESDLLGSAAAIWRHFWPWRATPSRMRKSSCADQHAREWTVAEARLAWPLLFIGTPRVPHTPGPVKKG